MKRHYWFAHLAILAANLIYGINYSVAKLVLGKHIEPFGFVLLRVLGTILLIWTVAFAFVSEKVTRKDLRLLFFCGLFGVGINQLLFFWGLSLTTPINSSIIMVCTPILVLIMAALIMKEKIHPFRITGIFLGLGGAVTLLLVKPHHQLPGNIFGDFITFLNACSYAVYLVLVKPLMQKYHPVTVMKWIFIFGLIPVFPVGIQQFLSIEWYTFDVKIYSAIAFVVIGTTFLAYLLNTYGLVRLSPAVVSAYIYLQPVFATVIALLLQTDHLDVIKIISSLMIFAGVYLVSIPLNKPGSVRS